MDWRIFGRHGGQLLREGSVCLLLAVVCPVVPGQRGAAAVLTPGCGQENTGAYHCNPENFRERLTRAHTVSVEGGSLDRFTVRELRHLAERMGKQVVPAPQSADLTFTVVPANQSAVSMGPADYPLASLLVYARSGQAGGGTLVWSETFAGQADRPWPMVVRAVVDQFQSRWQPVLAAKGAASAK